MSDPELTHGGYTFDRPSLDDAAGLFAVDSDPAVWLHSPTHVDESIDDAREALERSLRRWADIGLDYWVLHDFEGTVVGMAGARLMRGYWNLYARITPPAQGRGLAAATQRAALAAARAHRPELPVVGRLRVTNDPSRRLMERVGQTHRLTYAAEDGGADWHVYADRPLTDELIRYFTS